MAIPPRSSAKSAPVRERRTAPRRRRSVRVLFMSNDCALDEPFRATLLDASHGGLRLAVRRERISEGSLLMVMPPQAPPGTAWVPVLVKNCRPKDDAWEVGCQFTQRLTAQTMQLFAS
ncbi:MAG: PilZ domain-containing protein [Planctomycetia bacterium]|nr:PilZ domain-containing protein [Planctomycetia bacterium]